MEGLNPSDVGAVGIFVILIMEKAFEFIKGFTNKNKEELNKDSENMVKINELWESHLGPTAKDQDGRYKWWVPASLEESVRDLTKAVEKLTSIIEKMEKK